ncbi:MAG: 5-(carboxyamino)imidazole ribonucleotide synthase [Halieaceae bacterium]|jgi:5-(carboxyamino)imidazole ribonucleotide synthase
MAETTVGIIGDGQLGMMLCEAAPALGLRTVILATDPLAPAARRASSAIRGGMDDEEALASLIAQSDVITYEREDVPAPALALLRAAEARGSVECYPRLDTIALLQDKALQKVWLEDKGLPTLPFVLSDGSTEQQREAVDRLGYPLVQKALRGGFDGRGVQLLREPSDLHRAWPGNTLYERFAGKFEELAVLVARGKDGSRAHFGPVAMTFESSHSVLDTVSAPATQTAAVLEAATEIAHRAVEALDGVGVFGIELFVVDGQQVLINEISPRVHNAGHYTLEACRTSQFEQHLRAISGMPLGDTGLLQPAAMRNLLCTSALQQSDRTAAAGQSTDSIGSRVYWYGKSPARLMRKLGHVTALADSPEEALSRTLASWESIQAAGGQNTEQVAAAAPLSSNPFS